MEITKYIKDFFTRKKDNTLISGNVLADWHEPCMPFSDVIFSNICDLLTDIVNDVTLIRKDAADTMDFVHFKAFFANYGKIVLSRLFEYGFVVIGIDAAGLWLMRDCEYTQQSTEDGSVIITPIRQGQQVYVMKSSTFDMYGKSDKMMLRPYLQYLDNVMNGSNTISARLGSLILLSPHTPSNSPTAVALSKEQKNNLEEEIGKEYGSLSKQKQVMLLTRAMDAQVINMAGIDQRTIEKARLAILAICDRIKVPANQVAIIDANSSKSLSNGSELREGDFNKYQSFERLLNATFVRMADNIGCPVDYTIYNKPTRPIING